MPARTGDSAGARQLLALPALPAATARKLGLTHRLCVEMRRGSCARGKQVRAAVEEPRRGGCCPRLAREVSARHKTCWTLPLRDVRSVDADTAGEAGERDVTWAWQSTGMPCEW